jgi:hypothetical protein
MPVGLPQSLGPLGIRENPGESACSFRDLETGSFFVPWLERLTTHNLDGAHQDTPWKSIHVDPEFRCNSYLFVGLDTLQAGVNVDTLAFLGGPPGAGFHGLQTTQD